jgi:hypothetical protein
MTSFCNVIAVMLTLVLIADWQDGLGKTSMDGTESK